MTMNVLLISGQFHAADLELCLQCKIPVIHVTVMDFGSW